jgi:hypothetical protein
MAIKKIKSDLSIEQKLLLAGSSTDRVLVNTTNGVVVSDVTTTELNRLDGITSALLQANDKGVANGVASLDANAKIPSAQLPALAITEVFVVANIAARDALVVGSDDGEIQEGDVVIVTDASDDPAVDAGGASYIYDGSAWQRLLTPDNLVISVNGQTGVVVLDSGDLNHTQADDANWTVADGSSIAAHLDELADRIVALEDAPQTDELVKISANDTTSGYLEDKIVVSSGSNTTNILEVSTLNDAGNEDLQIQIDQAKIDHDALLNFVGNEHVDHSAVDIETAANSGLAGGGDITATRSLVVDVDNATAETSVDDTDLILIHDASVDALRKMTRSNFLAGVVQEQLGDIDLTNFSFVNNQVAAANVTGLAFANADVRSFIAEIAVERGTEFEHHTITGIQLNASWDIVVESVGDDTGIVFSVTSLGQVQYTSTDDVNGGVMRFRAKAIGIV